MLPTNDPATKKENISAELYFSQELGVRSKEQKVRCEELGVRTEE